MLPYYPIKWMAKIFYTRFEAGLIDRIIAEVEHD